MSLRIGAALRRELPAIEELRADTPALPGAEGEELALQVPVRRPSAAATLPAPAPPPSARALGSLVAVTGRLTEPGALAPLGEAAGPVQRMLAALEELLAMSRAVDHQRKLGVQA